MKQKERGKRYNKFLWGAVAISVIAILAGGYFFVNGEDDSPGIWICIGIIAAVWVVMGLSVWIYGAYDMLRLRKK